MFQEYFLGGGNEKRGKIMAKILKSLLTSPFSYAIISVLKNKGAIFMKRFLKSLSLILVVALTLVFLAACSTFDDVKTALEEIGYTELTEKNEDAEQMEEETDVAVEAHVFSNQNSLPVAEAYKINFVIVYEFNATEDMIEFYKDSETMQGFIKDVQEAGRAEQFYKDLVEKGYANGNCLVLSTNPLSADAVKTAVKNA